MVGGIWVEEDPDAKTMRIWILRYLAFCILLSDSTTRKVNNVSLDSLASPLRSFSGISESFPLLWLMKEMAKTSSVHPSYFISWRPFWISHLQIRKRKVNHGAAVLHELQQDPQFTWEHFSSFSLFQWFFPKRTILTSLVETGLIWKSVRMCL